ncbi:MAG: hypothetical protein ABIF85_01650 [Nanoarchaeota archaeon]
MKSKLLVLVIAIFAIVAASSISFAIGFGLPNQFWGTVTINGAPAPEGTSITAKINGVLSGSATTSGGSYNLIVDNPTDNNIGNLGDTVLIYVNGVQAGSDFFVEGGSTQVDLAITVLTPSSNPSGGSGSGGGGGGSSGRSAPASTNNVQTTPPVNNAASSSASATPSGPCRERWICDAWSACNKDGIQKRNCVDANKCGTIDDLPMSSQPCATEKTATSENSQKASGGFGNMVSGLFLSAATPAGAGIIAALLIICYFVYSYSAKKGRKK